jgi:uncharacterized protein involved in response to NO
MGLGVVGLLTGYLPLGHYLMKDSLPSCPAAPVHGHSILLSFVGMSVFGLLYRALPGWMGTATVSLALVRAHFWLAVVGILGVCINGTIGYEVLAVSIQPDFYYLGPAGQNVRNLWFAIDGLFLTVYGVGCLIFFYILVKKTAYGSGESAP